MRVFHNTALSESMQRAISALEDSPTERTPWEKRCVAVSGRLYRALYRALLPLMAVLWAVRWSVKDAWAEVSER